MDYDKFLARHDLVFDEKPVYPFDCPFMGNGSTGALLYFKDDCFYMNIGNTDIYDNRVETEEMTHYESQNLFMTPRLPLGGFFFETDEKIVSCKMRLTLINGVTSGTLFGENGSVDFTCFVPQNDEAVIFEWKENGLSGSFRYSPCPAISPRQKKMVHFNPKNLSAHYDEPKAPKADCVNGAEIYIQPKFTSSAYSVAYKTVEKAGKKLFAVMIADNDSPDAARLDEILASREKLLEESEKFWLGYYKKSFLSLDDTMLEGFYWIQLYKCACSTRSGKRVFDTAGPWLTDETAWPATWWNLNVELNFSPLFPANHTDIAVSLPQTIMKSLPVLAENVPAEKRNGKYITLGRDTTSTLASRCAAPREGQPEAEVELGNILWALHGCYAYYKCECLHGEIKGRFYDTLANAVDYVACWLYRGEDGKLHIPPTCSPEYPGISKDCSYTLSLLRWGFITLVEIGEKYGVNDARLAGWKKQLEELTDYAIDEKEGIKIGADIPLSMSHRHYSHLLMFYPLHIYTEDDPERRAVIEKSINHWQSMPEGLLGYSQTGAASMYSVLGNGEKAYKHLMNLFGGFVRENTMYHEDLNPVLETPPAAARSILDMLMLSFGDEIRLFVGKPEKWQNIAFKNLLCENGCTVSAKTEQGKITFVEITAKEDCTFTLVIPPYLCEKGLNEKSVISLAAGEKFTFGEAVIEPVEPDPAFLNYFGKHKN